MYAVISSLKYYSEIEQAISSKGDEILFKDYNMDVNITEDIDKIIRLSIRHLIIDLSCISEKKEFINMMNKYRVTNDKTQIIIIAPNCVPGNEVLNSLVTMGIYDIIAPAEDDTGNTNIAPLLLDVIDNPLPYKRAVKWLEGQAFDLSSTEGKGKDIKVKEKIVEKVVEVEKTVVKIQKSQVITFYTPDNSMDKDDVLTQISCLMAKKTEQSILVIDLNTMAPTLDHYFGIDKEIPLNDVYNVSNTNSGLVAVYNAIEKNIFTANLLEDIVIKHNKFKNLYVLTGLYDLQLFEKLDIRHYEILIDTAKQVFDTIIINTNVHVGVTATYISLVKASSVIAVSNSNYTNARNTISVIEFLIKYNKFPKEKFKILINNFSNYGLSHDYINKIFEDYEIIGYIPQDPNREVALNKKVPYITTSYAKKHIDKYIYVLERLGYIPKKSWYKKIFNKKENEVFSTADEMREV